MMKCFVITTLLLLTGARISSQHVLSKIKMPPAPQLPKLDYDSLPQYVKSLLLPVKSKHDNTDHINAAIETKSNTKVPKMYGMNLVNDHGIVWNTLHDPGHFYEVGKPQQAEKKQKNFTDTNNKYKSTVGSIKNNLEKVENHNAIVKDENKNDTKTANVLHEIADILHHITKDRSATPLSSAVIETTTTYTPLQVNLDDYKNFDTTKKDTITTSKPLVNEEKPKKDLEYNLNDELIQDIENSILNIIENINTIINKPEEHDFESQNPTSDPTLNVPKIPLPELESIFNEIIKNYSQPANLTVDDDTKLSVISNIHDLSQLKNLTISVNNLNLTLIGHGNTEATKVEISNISDIRNEKEEMKPSDDSKVSNSKTPEENVNEKENTSNNKVSNQLTASNIIDVVKQLLNDDSFHQLVNESITRFLQPFLKHLALEIKDEVAVQMRNYFESIIPKNVTDHIQETLQDSNDVLNIKKPEDISNLIKETLEDAGVTSKSTKLEDITNLIKESVQDVYDTTLKLNKPHNETNIAKEILDFNESTKETESKEIVNINENDTIKTTDMLDGSDVTTVSSRIDEDTLSLDNDN